MRTDPPPSLHRSQFNLKKAFHHEKNSLKIAVVGGGSSYTPELIEGILVRQDHLPVRELVLVDVPMGAEKVSIIESLARRMAAKAGADIHIHATMDRPSAIRGADFVITQFRVGGLDARAKDESIPLKYDIIGQETTGPGVRQGIAHDTRHP